MGADPRYSPLPWNSPDRLGRRIKLVVPETPGVDDPGLLLFTTVASSIVDLAVQHEDGQMGDDDVKAALEAMLQDTANLILGVR
jgi:hypothetical protein